MSGEKSIDLNSVKYGICLNQSLYTHVRKAIVVHPRITIIKTIKTEISRFSELYCCFASTCTCYTIIVTIAVDC